MNEEFSWDDFPPMTPSNLNCRCVYCPLPSEDYRDASGVEDGVVGDVGHDFDAGPEIRPVVYNGVSKHAGRAGVVIPGIGFSDWYNTDSGKISFPYLGLSLWIWEFG